MRSVTVHELKSALADGEPVVVDVREPDEFAQGHVPGARLVPLQTVPGLVGELPTDEPVYLVCAVGRPERAGGDVPGPARRRRGERRRRHP